MYILLQGTVNVNVEEIAILYNAECIFQKGEKRPCLDSLIYIVLYSLLVICFYLV